MKIAVLGAGAMGSLYAAGLKKAGHEVSLLASRKEHIDVLNQNGLIVREESGEEICYRIPAFSPAEYTGKADAVLLFTKTGDSEKALASLNKAAFSADTVFISFQNGLENEEVLQKYAVDDDHIIIGTTNLPSDRKSDSMIVRSGEGITKMMTVSGKETESLLELAKAFSEGGLNPVVDPQIFKSIWEKAAFNAAVNSLTAVTLLPMGGVGGTLEGRELAHKVIEEMCLAANAKGIPADAKAVSKMADRLFTEHTEHCPSMLQDVMAKRQTEIEFINGAGIRAGEKLGIDMPVTKTLYRLVSMIQKSYAMRKTI